MTPSPTVQPGVSVVGALADMARRGITLQAHAGKVRFRPRSAMTPGVAERIKSHRSAVMALLTGRGIPGTDKTAMADNATGTHDRESGVSSVVSVSERAKHVRSLWSEDELAMLTRAGTTPADLPLVSAVKDAFADFRGDGGIRPRPNKGFILDSYCVIVQQ